jgi:teichoic acid transport system permease protein
VTVGAPPPSAAEVAARYDLPRLGGRPSLVRYVTQLHERRHFTVELARSRFQAAKQQDRLGLAWIVLQPLINAAVYGAIFGFLLPPSTRPENFVAFLVTGVFVFQFFAGCLSSGAKSITSNLGLVRALHFPRALLPISVVLQQLFSFGPMLVVLAAVVLLSGEPLAWTWLLVAPATVVLAMFSLGVAFIAGRLTIHIRDFVQLVPFLTRVLFYTSGIFFSVDRVTDNQALRTLLEANPLQVFIALFRGSLMSDQPLAAQQWIVGSAWALGTCLAGFAFFWLAEARYGRE